MDLVLKVPRECFDPQIILEAISDIWPDARFQDADSTEVLSLDELLRDSKTPASSEFFVYRDDSSAQKWAQNGWSPDNSNSMVHFLIQPAPSPSDLVQITMVVDELRDDAAELFIALRSSLGELRQKKRMNLEAELRSVGCSLSRAQFSDLVDQLRTSLYPDWSPDELACHPHDAQQFCESVRQRASAPVPDHVIMKAMLNLRKRSAP
jgi:hypothetical protein